MTNLKELFVSCVDEMLDRIVDEESDLNNQDLERFFDNYFEVDFNSHYEWWGEFPVSELTIDDMNELLTCYSSLVSEGLATHEDLSVQKLLRLYPHYQVGLLKDEFIQSLEYKIIESLSDSDENLSESDENNIEQL